LLDKAEKDVKEVDKKIAIFERILIYLGYIEKGGLSEKELKELEKRIKEMKNGVVSKQV
jgi:hypothetical protein